MQSRGFDAPASADLKREVLADSGEVSLWLRGPYLLQCKPNLVLALVHEPAARHEKFSQRRALRGLPRNPVKLHPGQELLTIGYAPLLSINCRA